MSSGLLQLTTELDADWRAQRARIWVGTTEDGWRSLRRNRHATRRRVG